MQPTFSIITCTRNSAGFVRQNIDSVQNQSFNDYEHIFIDGLSTDGTKEMILKYQKANPEKVKLFQSEPKGITDAINMGVNQSIGRYLIHLHSDDYLYNNDILKDTADFLERNGYPDWIYAKELKVDSNGRVIKKMEPPAILKRGSSSIYCRYLLKYYNFIRHQSVFIKRDVFERHGYFSGKFPVAMDYEFWLRIRNKTRWVYFDRTVDCFRTHDNGKSTAPYSRDEMRIDEMRAGRLYMNGLEFYVLRPIFKVLAHSFVSISEQLRLYRMLK